MNKKRTCISKMPKGLADFIAKARFAQERLSNPQFNAVLPAPATVIANLDQLQVYLTESLAHNYAHVEARERLRKETQAMISQQVSYVNSIADGNEGILELSGFELSKVPAPKPMPEQGKVLGVINLNEGQVIFQYKHIPGCTVYELEVKGPNGYNRKEISLYTKVKMSDLPVGVSLRVRVCGRNNKGEGVWSNYYNFISNIVAANEDDSSKS